MKEALVGGGSGGSPEVDGAADVRSTLPCLLKAPLPPLLLRAFWAIGVPNAEEDDGVVELLFCLRLWLNFPRPRQPPRDPAFELDLWPLSDMVATTDEVLNVDIR